MTGSISILSNFYNRAIKDMKSGYLDSDISSIKISYSDYYNGGTDLNFSFEIIDRQNKENYIPLIQYFYNTNMFLIHDKSGNELKISKSELFETPLEILVLTYGKFFLDDHILARLNSFGFDLDIHDLDVMWS